MAKVAIINDTHRGVRNSGEIFLEDANAFYQDIFFPYLVENNIKNIVHLGDYFDNRRFLSVKALKSDRDGFLRLLEETDTLMHIIPGNHDTVYRNTNDVCSIVEILGDHPNIKIYMEPTVLDFDGLKMGLVPWINPSNHKSSVEFIRNCNAPILGGHFELVGFDMMPGQKCTHGMEANIFSKYEMVLSGHFHTKSTQGNIHYLGTQMEFTWSDAHDDKFFHVIDTETRELEAIRNPRTLFQKVYYNDREQDYTNADAPDVAGKFVKVVVVEKKDPYIFDRYVEKITSQDILDIKISENLNEFIGENVEDDDILVEDTTSLLDTYVDAVETELDKDVIKDLMKRYYVEAQNMETA